MNTDVQLLYDQLMLGDLGQLEERRRAYVSQFYKVLLGVLVIEAVLLLGLFGVPDAGTVFAVTMIALGIGWIIWMAIKHSRFSTPYRAEFKAKVIPELVRHVDKRLEYDAYRSMMNAYHDSVLFPRSIDRHKAEDTISGTFDQTTFAFGEIHTEYRTTSTDSKGNRREHWHTIFKGLFFSGDFNKNFAGETIIDQDNMERLFGSIGRKLQQWNPDRKGDVIRLENPEFEKRFVAYSTDEQECRYILTPSLMERILALNQKTGGQICMSFRNSNVYVAFAQNGELFEPRIFGTTLKLEEAELLISLIGMMTGIVEDLNLNTRIWTKE